MLYRDVKHVMTLSRLDASSKNNESVPINADYTTNIVQSPPGTRGPSNMREIIPQEKDSLDQLADEIADDHYAE